MEIPKIERYVSDLLTVSGFSEEGAEHHLWVLLHHLYSAVAMYEQLSAEDKAVVAETQKKLKYFFETKCNLKERKNKKTEKEETSPTPPIEEKEKINKKEEKPTHTLKRKFSASLEERREAFKKECFKYEEVYSNDFIADFFNWFSEVSQDGDKMRFEEQRYFSVKNRLKKWSKNSVSSEKEFSAAKAQFVKGKAVERQVQAEEERALAAERERANLEREQQQEESKQGAVSYEEWVQMRKNTKD